MPSLPKGLQVTLCPTDVSEYTSQVYSGLFDLRERGEIRVRIKPLKRRTLRFPHSVYLECSNGGLIHPRRIFIDLIDAERLHSAALEEVDVYAKRSLKAITAARLGRARLIPYGLQFAANTPSITSMTRATLHWRASFRGGVVYSPVQRLQAAGAAAVRLIHRGSVIGTRSPRPLAAVESGMATTTDTTDLRPGRSSLRSAAFEEKLSQVFFATRVYSPEEAPHAPEREAVNETRAALVRELRLAFGGRFIGGLRHSTFAQTNFGDCVYKVPDNHTWHYRAGRQSLIHINSTGLHSSTGWKFAEALAQQSCLVSEPCSDLLPEPLIDGQHYLSFTGVDECVAHCEKLLRNPSLAELIRFEGHRYYLNAVRPDALVRNLLLESLRDGS